jgi:hypothetical protein
MTENMPEKPKDDDIENCRKDILKANNQNPSGGSSENIGNDQNSPDENKKPKIPSFEDMIAKEPQHSENHTEITDDSIDVKEIGNILSESGPVNIENMFNDEKCYDLIEEEDDCIQMLNDTDWQMIEQPSSNLDDVPMDNDDDNSLEMMVNADDNEPLISKQEQDMLMAEFNNDDQDNQDNFEVSDTEDDDTIEQIQQGISALSADKNDESDELESTQQGNIPDFDVYDKILSNQRKQSSANRQAPKRIPPKKSEQPAGTVGDIIRQTKADQPPIQNQPEPMELNDSINKDYNETKPACIFGIVFQPDNMNQMQHRIIEEIVKRDIDALCV